MGLRFTQENWEKKGRKNMRGKSTAWGGNTRGERKGKEKNLKVENTKCFRKKPGVVH